MGSWTRGGWQIEAAGLGIPATYTPEDPYDIQGKAPLINAMQVDWMNMSPEQQKQVIINAFRATMLSPRMNLKSNAILYQNLMSVPADESNPDVFENIVREMKKKWDAQGQMGLDQQPSDVIPVDELAGGGKYMPGFWGNIRRLANLGPYAETIRQIAVEDMTQHNGDGTYFRDQILKLGIPGVQAKVASFAWLALAPNTSELATVDVHMMRHLKQDGLDSPKNTQHYLQLEDQLRQERDQTYGPDVPLSWYQWGVWDARRTPGYHQDHTPLRADQPTPYQDVQWPATTRPPRPYVPPTTNEDQMTLAGWVIDPRLARYRKY